MEKYNSKIKNSRKYELIQVSMDRDPSRALSWAKKESFPWHSVPMAKMGAAGMRKYKIRGVPTYILVDKNGKEITRSKSQIDAKLDGR